MSTATMTSKGQITIPKDLREKLGLDTGDRVEFVETATGAFTLVPATRDIKLLKGMIVATRSVSVEEMNRTIRQRALKE